MKRNLIHERGGVSRCTRSHVSGFSLVELLVVLAIVAIVTALAAPSLFSAMASSKLNSASQLVSDYIALARQEAVSKDRNVQVRFYNITSGQSQGWCAVQVIRIEQISGSSTLVPVTHVQFLPSGVVVSPNATLSPLLTADSTVSGTVNLAVYGNTSFAGFYFLPSGMVESALTASNNFLTLQNATASGSPPANYSTVQVNPVTGKVILYRP